MVPRMCPRLVARLGSAGSWLAPPPLAVPGGGNFLSTLLGLGTTANQVSGQLGGPTVASLLTSAGATGTGVTSGFATRFGGAGTVSEPARNTGVGGVDASLGTASAVASGGSRLLGGASASSISAFAGNASAGIALGAVGNQLLGQTNKAESLGGTAGGVAGAGIGTAIFPGVGTVVGGILGSLARWLSWRALRQQSPAAAHPPAGHRAAIALGRRPAWGTHRPWGAKRVARDSVEPRQAFVMRLRGPGRTF